MKYTFHSEAEAEFQAAVEYYEGCLEGLGLDFAAEVQAAVENILSYPTAWRVLEDNVRRCLTRRFPYGVLYTIEPEGVLVLAVMHLQRDPGYWKRGGGRVEGC